MADQQSETQDRGDRGSNWKVWVVTSVAALMTGFAAYYFIQAETWGGTFMKMLQGEEPILGTRISGIWATIIPAGFMATMMMLIVVVQRKWFAGTEGTGIPQAMAALKIGECPQRSMMLSIKISIGKILLLTGALFSGITVGREGPSVHVGACYMYLCSRFFRLPSFLVERGLILAGSAAGIAAAFNTPIAGIIFCFEEVGHLFDKKSVVCIIRTTALACGVCVFFMGNYYFYGAVNAGSMLPLGTDSPGPGDTFLGDLRQWIAVPVIAVFAGFLGGWFGRLVVLASKFTSPFLVKHPWKTGAVLGLALAVIAICSFGESYTGGYTQAKAMLLEAHEVGEPTAKWYYPLAKASASFVSLISAIPGGLFDPSLATGAGLGQLCYPILNGYIAPGIGLPEVMMIFMCAYFTGVVQSPITVFTIMFEMTGAYGMILPLMFAALIAAWIANMICKPSIYEALACQFLEAKGLRKLAPPERD
ncbi:MAG: chloride channel protein [Planctomycetota bacterium]|nr:chloride channel protein [Planctomycetota bacterium]